MAFHSVILMGVLLLMFFGFVVNNSNYTVQTLRAELSKLEATRDLMENDQLGKMDRALDDLELLF